MSRKGIGKSQKKIIRSEENKMVKWSKSYWLQIPLIIVVAIIPLIVFYQQYSTGLSHFDWFGGNDIQSDFYRRAKMQALLVVTGCMVVILLFQHFFNEHKMIWDKKWIPLLVYAVLTILSTCFSVSKYHSLHGSYQHFESVWVLLGYCIVAYYTFYLLRTEAAIKRFLNWFGIGVGVMTFIGMSQVLGVDFLQTKLGKTLMTPQGFDINNLTFNIEKGRTYLTLANPNFAGSYVALVVPVLTGLVLVSEKLWKKIVYGILVVLMLVILFASESRTGILALVFTFFVLLLFFRKKIIKRWKISLSCVLVLLIAFGVVDAAKGNILSNKILGLVNIKKTDRALQYIETNQDNVVVGYNDNQFIMEWSGDSLKLSDQKGKILGLKQPDSEGWSYIDDDRFPFQLNKCSAGGYEGYELWIGGLFKFVKKTDGEQAQYYCYFRSQLMKLSKGKEYTGFFADHLRFGSGRGFIWSRTFPLLKKYFWVGSGPDTYVQVFPYEDVIGFVQSDYYSTLMSKPHSFYLQIGEQTGVPSLLAWFVFVGIYFVDCIRLYWKNTSKGYLCYMGMAIMLSVIGFLITGLANDSIIGVTPVFYAILGLGFRINHLEQDSVQ